MSAGYNDIVTASSGWEALKMLDVGRNTDETPAFDIVLLDIVMPEMDGIETCARIRNDPRYADLPIIMVTSLRRHGQRWPTRSSPAPPITSPSRSIAWSWSPACARRSQLKAELDRRQARERELLGFLSSWGDRRASRGSTRRPACSSARSRRPISAPHRARMAEELISIVALMLDRFDAYRSAHGERAAQQRACPGRARRAPAGGHHRHVRGPLTATA